MKLFCEAAAVSGVAATIYGIMQWSEPLAWIVGGMVALTTGCLLYPKGNRP